MYTYTYIYTHTYIYIVYTWLSDSAPPSLGRSSAARPISVLAILDFRGLDSSGTPILRGGILMSIGNFRDKRCLGSDPSLGGQ